MTTVPFISIPVSPSDLLDRITILQLKRVHFTDPHQQQTVQVELDLLCEARKSAISNSDQLDALYMALQAVNATLWDLEDQVRAHEQDSRFDLAFVEAARAIFHHNTERNRIKRQIDALLGAAFTDEKAYAPRTTSS